MVLIRRVVKARLLLKLTSHLFLEGSKLYSLCEGLHKVELKSLSLKSSWRLCKGTNPVMERASSYEQPG